MDQFKQLLIRIQYHRRFQEYCFLFRYLFPYRRRGVTEFHFKNFWLMRAFELEGLSDVPEIREYHQILIERACKECDIAPTRENVLLLFACVAYGVARTSKSLLRLLENKDPTVDFPIEKEPERDKIISYLVIRYLWGLLESHRVSVPDPVADQYVAYVIDWLNTYGFIYYSDIGGEADSIKKEVWQDRTLALIYYYLYKRPQYDKVRNVATYERRNREIKRNYYFWRWKDIEGLSYGRIADRWNRIHPDEWVSGEDVVQKGIERYHKQKCGPIFTNPGTLERFRMLMEEKKPALEMDIAQYLLEKALGWGQ